MTGELGSEMCDHEAARLLPWFVVDALSAEDTARVQAHLKECERCTADEKRERRVQALMSRESAIEYAPQPGLQALLTRIDELERELPASTVDPSTESQSSRPRAGWVRWLAAAVVVQAIGLGVLGALLWQQGVRFQAPRFATLTSSAQPVDGAQIRVVFAPSMTVAEVQSLLVSIPATVVQGPSEAGVYTVSLPQKQSSVDTVLKRLREHPGVLFAEPGHNP